MSWGCKINKLVLNIPLESDEKKKGIEHSFDSILRIIENNRDRCSDTINILHTCRSIEEKQAFPDIFPYLT